MDRDETRANLARQVIYAAKSIMQLKQTLLYLVAYVFLWEGERCDAGAADVQPSEPTLAST